MKKRLVNFLCCIGLYRIARKISPQFALHWEIQREIKKLSKSFAETGKACKETVGSLKNLSDALQKSKVVYICDRQKCEKCSFPECEHTTDIEHAANFKNVGGLFMEKTESEFYNSKEWRAFRQKLIAERTK